MNRTLHMDPRRHPELMTRLAMASEEIKCHLSTNQMAEGAIDGLPIGGGRPGSLQFSVSRKQFEGLIVGFVDRTIAVLKQVLHAAHVEPRDVSEVLCVGGSTRIPLVRQRIAEVFGRPPQIRINPDEVVAYGAAIQAGSLSGNIVAGTGMATVSAVRTADLSPLLGDVPSPDDVLPPPRPLLLDVTPATLGVGTAGGYAEKVLERNAPIPIERTRIFTTAQPGQTRVVIECCRGESRRFAENEPLGTLVLEGLPAAARGQVQIEVTFRVDTDGILHVQARDPQTGIEQQARLTVLGAPVAGGLDL
jgi:molecular chaperone DnaK